MNGNKHEFISVLALLITLSLLFLFIAPELFLLGQLSLGWLIQTFYINNDVDANYSKSKNRIGYFKYLFIFTKHRGIMHNPLLWVVIWALSWHLGYGWFGAGIFGSSVVHCCCDDVSDLWTVVKRKLPF